MTMAHLRVPGSLPLANMLTAHNFRQLPKLCHTLPFQTESPLLKLLEETRPASTCSKLAIAYSASQRVPHNSPASRGGRIRAASSSGSSRSNNVGTVQTQNSESTPSKAQKASFSSLPSRNSRAAERRRQPEKSDIVQVHEEPSPWGRGSKQSPMPSRTQNQPDFWTDEPASTMQAEPGHGRNKSPRSPAAKQKSAPAEHGSLHRSRGQSPAAGTQLQGSRVSLKSDKQSSQGKRGCGTPVSA